MGNSGTMVPFASRLPDIAFLKRRLLGLATGGSNMYSERAKCINASVPKPAQDEPIHKPPFPEIAVSAKVLRFHENHQRLAKFRNRSEPMKNRMEQLIAFMN
jgi:hypothetical protein